MAPGPCPLSLLPISTLRARRSCASFGHVAASMYADPNPRVRLSERVFVMNYSVKVPRFFVTQLILLAVACCAA